MRPSLRTIAAALAAAVCVSLAHAQALRPEIGKPLQQAADFLKAGRAKDALARARDADAVANKTAAEQLTIDRMIGAAAQRAGDQATAIRALSAVFASGKLGGAEQAQVAEQLAFAYSQTRDWPRTREWANKAQQLGGNSAQLRQLLAYVSSQTGDYAGIARDAQAAVAAAEQAGRAPDEADLLRLADAQQRGGNAAGQAATLEKLVAYYPKKEYWSILLGRLAAKPGFSGRLSLDLFRLRAVTKTLDKAEDVVELAQLALQGGQAAEAKQVLDDGYARGLLGKNGDVERQKRLLNLITSRAAGAPKDLAASEAEATAARDGDALVRIGLGYSGLGQHDKAIALIQEGIKRGGLRNPSDANLHLGIALHRAGQKQRAAQAFKAVSGTDGAADLARLWMRVP